MARRTPSQLNCLIAVDKPFGCTSHDVVARVRRACHERRVGHAGTLDPLASGVMVIGIGQATRLLGRITQDTKAYVADIVLGSETLTDDAEGAPSRVVSCDERHIDMAFAHGVLKGFIGTQMQVPPAYSAISVDGVRSYKRARAGEDVELPAREITVFDADLLAVSEIEGSPIWTVAFTVSKGTYIRALARDIGRAAETAAHVQSLRRTASGVVSLATCCAVDDLSPELDCDMMLDPVRTLGIPAIEVSESQCADVSCGRALPLSLVEHASGPVDESTAVAIVYGGQLRALARHDGSRLVMTDVFPQGITGVRP